MLEFQEFCRTKNPRNITLKDCEYYYKKIIVDKEKIDEKYLILFTNALIKQLSTQFGRKVKLIVKSDREMNKLNYDENDVLATHTKNYIWMRESVLLSIQNRPLDFFQILFHELYHVYQNKCYFDKEVSYSNYRFIQENFLISEKYLLQPEKYYKKNYPYFYFEKMANKYGTYWAKSYLFKIQYGHSLSQKDYLAPNYCESVINYDLLGMKKNLDIVFNDYIRRNKKVLWDEPLFRYEYHLNGKRRSTSELLLLIEKEKKYDTIIFLKELVIKREFSLYDLINDYTDLLKKRDRFYDQIFVDLLLKKYIYYKLERELTTVPVKYAISLLDNIIYDIRISYNDDIKLLLIDMKKRFQDGVKIRRKVPIEF